MGCGRVGSSLAFQLAKRDVSVAVIDQDPLAFRRLGDNFPGQQVTGVGFDRETLQEAGIEQADAFAAVSSGDNSNIIAARVARETFNVQRVVARIYDPKRAEVYERLGIPTVATVTWTASRLLQGRAWARPASRPGATRPARVLDAARDAARGVDGPAGRRLPDQHRRTGRGADPVRHRRWCRPARPSSRTATRCTSSPRPTTPRRCATRSPQPPPEDVRVKVAIAGAGAVGRSIARELLGNKHQVLMIDKDPDKITPDRIPGAEWLLGDACEVANLEDADLEQYDVMVGATGDDKVNLVVSLLAKTEFSVRRVVARINHPSNEWLFNEAWGVDVAVSTPRVLAALVEEAVEVGDLVRLFGIREGQANLVEVTLPDTAPCAGHSVRDLDLPKDAALVTIVRGTRVITPTPEEPLEPGDELLFVVLPEAEAALRTAVVG